MSASSGDGEPLELCEECGSPLVDGICQNCGVPAFRDGTGPTGTAPMSRGELRDLLDRGPGGRRPGERTYGSLVLSMQQEAGMAPLRKEIDLLVERFSASPKAKASAKQRAESLAVKLMDELGPTKAAMASVAQFFIAQGRSLGEISSCISMIHPAIDRLNDIIVEVYPEPEGDDVVRVLVDGRERPFRSYSSGLYRKLRIPLFASDGNALVELKGARLTRKGYDPKRVEPLGPSEFQVGADETNFELFKILEEARLSGSAAAVTGGTDRRDAMFRKYSVSKLRLTERLLKEAGLLQRVSGEYARLFTHAVDNGGGRSPKKLAEEALVEACESAVPQCLCNSLWQKYRLRETGMRSLVVVSELAAWQG